MIIAKRLKGKAIAAWLGPAGDAARRAVTSVKRAIQQQPARELAIYLDVADPWSYLAAQATARLVEAYPVELAVHIVTPPASDVDPQPAQRANHAVRDAEELARYFDLEFPAKKTADPGLVRDLQTALVRERPGRDQLATFLALTGAMWAGDKKQVAALLGQYGTEAHMSVPPILNESYARLRKAGHYQPAMLHYDGEWYWGVDRMAYLEEALAHATDRPIAHVVHPRPEAARGKLALVEKERPITCELWFSFRSPYSYLALEQIEAILAPTRTPLVLRPMLPMVARGAQLPNVKRMYIVRDAKREADRLGIPFGELCDPLGPAVDHCLAIAKWANARGPEAALAWARSAMRGIWAEARDPAEYVDLRFLVERAQLPWEEAKAALADPDVVKWATANATDLSVIGLWGVPSYRAGDFVAWGNDRLPLLADRLRRHFLPA